MSGSTQTLYANSAKRMTRKATTRACRMSIKRLRGRCVPLRADAIRALSKGEICNFCGTPAGASARTEPTSAKCRLFDPPSGVKQYLFWALP